MKADYLPRFIKDLKALRGTVAFARIHKLAFEDAERWDSLDGIAGLKRLRGSSGAYRIRVGDYRIIYEVYRAAACAWLERFHGNDFSPFDSSSGI